MINQAWAVGVVSFTAAFKRAGLSVLEERNKRLHYELVAYLEGQGFRVVDPMRHIATEYAFGACTPDHVSALAQVLRNEEAECVVAGLWNWTDCILVRQLAEEADLPLALFTEDDISFGGQVAVAAVGATLWQAPPNSHALRHFRSVDKTELVPWIKGMASLKKIKKGALLLWGGSYCLKMEHLEDDFGILKSTWVRDILVESEYYLVKRCEAIRQEQPDRIQRFIDWLRTAGAQIIFDEEMLNENVFRTQVAMYFAAKDRLAELDEEHIIGVSIRDQPELSMEYGVTSCLLPAFLPFSEDSEGPKSIIPTVCEGDVKGLITCILLYYLCPEAPPLFGDFRIGRNYVVIGNCGGASIYYAANSNRASEVLAEVTIRGQCQGASGGAVGYLGKGDMCITIARLTRVRNEYYMQLGVGESFPFPKDVAHNCHIGAMWPFVGVDLGVDPKEILRTAGSNHYSAIPGDLTQEVTHACRELGIPVVRLDSIEDMQAFRQSL